MSSLLLYRIYYLLGFLALLISLYQFVDGRWIDGLLSLVFTMIFLGAGLYRQQKGK
ncbi:MAG: hypothetical protein HEP71_15045 [Roseivirga sp.]|nr:hypothetical protein [Roseivirga sp.]